MVAFLSYFFGAKYVFFAATPSDARKTRLAFRLPMRFRDPGALADTGCRISDSESEAFGPALCLQSALRDSSKGPVLAIATPRV